MEIDVLNEAWLSAVIGLVDKNIDVVRGYTCFRGEIKYDFNPLKVRGCLSQKNIQ